MRSSPGRRLRVPSHQHGMRSRHRPREALTARPAATDRGNRHDHPERARCRLCDAEIRASSPLADRYHLALHRSSFAAPERVSSPAPTRSRCGSRRCRLASKPAVVIPMSTFAESDPLSVSAESNPRSGPSGWRLRTMQFAVGWIARAAEATRSEQIIRPPTLGRPRSVSQPHGPG